MEKAPQRIEALDRAAEAVGGTSALAGLIGLAQSTVSMWHARSRVPAEYCPLIERATGGRVRCEELRPDVAWDVLRLQAGVEEGGAMASN